MTLCELAGGCAGAGRYDRVRELLVRLDEMSERRYVGPLPYAVVYYGLRDIDRAMPYFEQCLEEKHPLLRYVHCTWAFQFLYPEPRFRAFMKKVGVPLPTP